MHIEIIKCLQDNYSYLILDNTNNTACVIDPGEAKPIIDYIEKKNINLKFILNTHHHRDHVNGNLEIKKKFMSSLISGLTYLLEKIQNLREVLNILVFLH